MSCAVLGLATVNPVTSNDPCRVVNLVQICFIKLKRILICEITAWLGAEIAFILEALGRGERLRRSAGTRWSLCRGLARGPSHGETLFEFPK